MNVELTIQDMFDGYPGLFKERADCLDHLFCTIGNGFEWVDGELVNGEVASEYIKELESHLVDGKAFQHNKLSLRAEAIHYTIERKKKMLGVIPENPMDMFDELDIQCFDSLPDDVYYKHPRRKRWYFYINIPGHERIDFCEDFAFLFNYPDDIKPDWKDALEECKKLLIEDGFELPEVV